MRQKSEETRKRILKSAKKIIQKKGYSEASISEIAASAKVSPATLYNYFENKQAIFQSLDLDESYLEYNPAKDKKRREIVETALLMFGETGYEGTSLEALMNRMNMGKTSIYQFFGSKDELLAAVIQASRANLQARQLREKPATEDWRESTMEMGRAYLDMGNDPLREALFRTVLQQAASDPELGRVYYMNSKGTTSAALADSLKPYQEAGIIRKDLDLKLASFLFLCSLFGYNIYFKYLNGVEKEYTDEEALRHATEIFFSGICTPGVDDV